MKRHAINLTLLALTLAILACACPTKLRELRRDRAPPAPSTPTDTPKPVVNPAGKKGDYDLSLAKYEKIKVGTIRSDVESLLGGKGIEVSSSTGGGTRFSVNKWEGDGYRSIILSFRNDKVMTKSQVGLR